MGEQENGRKAFEIFEEIFAEEEQSRPPRQEGRGTMPAPLAEDEFYEIEYDSTPFPGVGKFVMKSSKIQAPPRDGIRERFDRMRDIARENRVLYFNSSNFYDKRIRQENAKIFYLQGAFMADFEDDYEKSQPYSAYFPSYQTMGYEQLRTYFTWRRQVRQGNIEGTSLSYAFLYIYELVNLIGIEDPAEGMEELLLFWDAYRQFDRSIDKYLPQWLKDFYIYYELGETFQEFVRENRLEEWYPELADPEDGFDLLCSVSKYDLRGSGFYGEGNEELVRSCFDSLMERLDKEFGERGMNLEELVFRPVKNAPEWLPFKGALFYPCLAQDDRKVMISDREVYFCERDRWTVQTTLTTESGKRLLGYVMKQMEAVLRQTVQYKHKLSASPKMLGEMMAQELELAGIPIERIVEDAVREFQRERNRTVVKVDAGALERIRREALLTQEKLTVPEETRYGADPGSQAQGAGWGWDGEMRPGGQKGDPQAPGSVEECGGEMRPGRQKGDPQAPGSVEECGGEMRPGGQKGDPQVPYSVEECGDGAAPAEESGTAAHPWRDLGKTLSETERGALALVLYLQDREGDCGPDAAGRESEGKDFPKELYSYESIRQFADAKGVMLEVLMDGINEKAMDQIGDSLLDEEFVIYDDYMEQTREMMEEIWRGR